jgi:hypothetical protein
MSNISTTLRCLFFCSAMVIYMESGARDHYLPVAAGHGSGDGGFTSNVPLNEINIHAFRHFRKMFPEVSGESWLKTEDGYTVSFVENARRGQAHFNPKGGFLYSVKYYAGAAIPAEIGAQIIKKYPGYRIGVVTEITDGEKTFRQIKIENPYSVKTISFCDGKMELVEDLVNGG